MGTWVNQLGFRDLDPPAGPRAPAMRQNGRWHDGWAVRSVVGLLFGPMPWLMRAIVTCHFRRLRVRHGPRFPRRGPVVLVANHPATWTDVLVLDVALGRKLHFLAHESLFRPLPRAWVLRLFGALPVASPSDGPEAAARNAETFERCAGLLARGEVVAVFPEGVSVVDRSIGRLRTGAARIALDHAARGGTVSLVPVGLHYADRMAFRADVVVSVGRPVRLGAAPPEAERAACIERLTSWAGASIAALIVELPQPSLRWLVEESASPEDSVDGAAFERLRRLARRIARMQACAPLAFAECSRHARRHRRIRERLGLAPADLASPSPRALAIVTLLAFPALVARVFHALPASWTARVAARYVEPARVGMARIVASLVFFTCWYAAAAIVTARMTGSVAIGLASALAAALLGGIALAWGDAWSRGVRGALRLRAIERRHPRLVVRLRREREALTSAVAWRERSPAPQRVLEHAESR